MPIQVDALLLIRHSVLQTMPADLMLSHWPSFCYARKVGTHLTVASTSHCFVSTMAGLPPTGGSLNLQETRKLD
jgi:hypothetical protein